MGRFEIQKESSTVNWTGKKVLGLHTGTIDITMGSIHLDSGKINGGEIVIDMTSLTITDINDRKTHDDFKDHLWNDDFFSINAYTRSHLKIEHGELLANNEYTLSGHLTIKDITHPISFRAKIEILTDFLYSTGEIVIDRTLYNIRYGSGKFIDHLGDKLIHDDFVLQFKLIGLKSQPGETLNLLK
jgi:polyisoprenoid-binding protein YceI